MDLLEEALKNREKILGDPENTNNKDPNISEKAEQIRKGLVNHFTKVFETIIKENLG